MISNISSKTETPPPLSELGLDLLRITPAQRLFTLTVPFVFVGLYLYAAFHGNWIVAVVCLMYLSFVTYGSTSHDLVHRNLGLPRPLNDFFLTLVELIALRSGHAYRMSHLHHHARFPEEDDIEASAARKSTVGALLEGTIFHFRLWLWAFRKATERRRLLVLAEGLFVFAMIAGSILVVRLTVVPFIYVVLMIAGAWITPLITSHFVHDVNGKTELQQTRVFRGKVFSVLALEHLYHLEHHLYPAVPHQNWPLLAKRLDPFFARQGIKPIRLWF